MEPLQVIAARAGLAAADELRSALPDSPVQPEPARPNSWARLRLASLLRRIADRLAPPGPIAETGRAHPYGRRGHPEAWTAARTS